MSARLPKILLLIAIALGVTLAVVGLRQPRQAETVTRAEPSADHPTPARRDVHLDRETTSVAEAYALYAEGVDLAGRLPLQAAARFRKAILLDDAFAPAHYRLALASLALSRRDEALAEAASAMRHQDRLPEPYRSVAPIVALYAAGSFDLAVAALRETLPRYPDEPDLHFLAGAISSGSCDHFDPNSSVEHFEKVLEADPGNAAAREGLRVASEMKGMNDYSLTRALQRPSGGSSELDALSEVARVRIARREYGDAIEAADEVVRQGQDPFARGLAPAFILAGHHDLIAAMYDPELERSNTASVNVVTHLHAGINDVWLGKFDKAIEHFERGSEFAPGAWERSRKALFFLLAGRTRSLTGRTREADIALEAAQQVVGPRAILEYCLGRNKIDAGSMKDAERALRRLSQDSRVSQPGWNEPWRLLLSGEIALASGQTARAIDEFRQAWQLERPLATDCIAGYVDAYFLDALGRAYLAAGRAPDALAAFEQIRALGHKALHQPEIAVMALFHSGLALQMLDRPAEAEERLGLFIKTWGDADNPPPQVSEARGKLQTQP